MPHRVRRERPRLLLVEDHRHMRQMLARLGDLSGWDVVECQGLSEAYRSLATHYGAYDAAIIDLMLGDGNGTDLVADLRRTRSAARIVVCSACEPGSDRVRSAMLAGADAYHHKPIDWTDRAATALDPARSGLMSVLRGDPGDKVPGLTVEA
jgi:DNA-binding response OmpR family regulator